MNIMQSMVGEFSKVTGTGRIFLPSRGKSFSNNSLSGLGRIGDFSGSSCAVSPVGLSETGGVGFARE
jgi:hypothetical protein